ncbi:unnamed protein product, partial [Gulo gulo]
SKEQVHQKAALQTGLLKTPGRYSWKQRRQFTKVELLEPAQCKIFGEGICDLIRGTKKNLKVERQLWMPTTTLKITTRKTPCSEGSKIWDHFQMRIHKQLPDMHRPFEIAKANYVHHY